MENIRINQEIQLNIEDINYDGLGVSHYNEMVVFVEGAIIGEIILGKVIEVKKNYIKCKIKNIIKRSEFRLENMCPNYPNCGGCQLLHLDYEKGLEVKLRAFNATIKKIGGLDLACDTIIGCSEIKGYRNKVQLPCAMQNEKLVVGYYKQGTHEVIPNSDCLLQSDSVSNVVRFIKNVCNEYSVSGYDEIKHTGVLRHILIRENYLGELMVVLVVSTDKIKNIDIICDKIVNKYKQVKSVILNINDKPTNVILGNKFNCLYGKDEIIDRINDVDYKISHRSFFQVNRIQASKLYNIVLDHLKDVNGTVLDAYCGVGSISLQLAKQNKRVIGIEVVNDAIIDARNNAELNNINNAEFICGKVEDEIDNIISKEKLDAIVIDPPRSGIDKNVVDCILNSGIKKVVYVSCNPATLARDLGLLKGKYDIEDVKLVDMFAYTNHVETVVCPEKK